MAFFHEMAIGGKLEFDLSQADPEAKTIVIESCEKRGQWVRLRIIADKSIKIKKTK